MHDHASPLCDVIVVGAGPVGLFLACELRLAGVSVRVLEQAATPDAPLKGLPFGMRGLSVPTVEAFRRRGLFDALVALAPDKSLSTAGHAGNGAHWQQPHSRRPGGHFAGIPFFQDKIDQARWSYRAAHRIDGPLVSDMARIETVLAERASALGAVIQRGVAVHDIDQSDDVVTVRSAGGDVFSARWLVGCDGGRSTIRKAAGFAFVGTDAEFTGYSVQVDLADGHTLVPGRHYTTTGVITYQKPGTIAMVDFDGGAFHRTAPITLHHVQSVLRHVSNTDITVTALHVASTWTDRARQATAYRNGRVLLAGDAAHIHSPLGGQGLNLGMGDAMNLGWKLAATIRGAAPADLLDSYFTERYPLGARILEWSRAQVALMRPSPSSRALEAIVRDLIDTCDGATYFAERVWGLSEHYDLAGTHPLVGRSAPDFALADGTTLAAHLEKGKSVLLDFDAAKPLETLAAGRDDRLSYVGCPVKAQGGLSAVLVRPDGIVACAEEGAATVATFAQAIARWLGPARGEPIALAHVRQMPST